MRTGIVFSIEKDKSIIMECGGRFIEVKTNKAWKKGDIVQIENKRHINKVFYYVAACILFMFLGISSFQIYFQQTTLISIDVNPSIEIGLNRFDRVIYINGMNDEGDKILKLIDIKNKSYDIALRIIAQNDELKEYVQENSYITFALQTNNKDKEMIISNRVEETFKEIVDIEDVEEPIFDIFVVDEEVVNEAHGHHMTAGKYMKIQELKEIEPSVEVADYQDKSINYIQESIDSHHGAQREQDDNTTSESETIEQNQTEEHEEEKHDSTQIQQEENHENKKNHENKQKEGHH